ncbi:DUF317 domain-containing protein [Streptomyces sp. NPDC058084]|uniref:DUF317 domain-containing protein n=1 Tax=Streptomyces sp. NPDC058084 TaxID=3346333 RepID=UPI0036ECE7E6
MTDTRIPVLAADEGEPAVAFDVLTKAAWVTHTDSSANSQVVAPGGQARLVFQPESAAYANTDVLWRVEAVTFAVDEGQGLLAIPAKPRTWSATFTGEVPVELIAAFLERLVAPEGVDRSPTDPDPASPVAIAA